MASQAKKTALYETHQNLNAKFVEFGGWEMPVQYSSIKDEHLCVRENCGLFDVSHMGEAWIEGPNATATVNNIITNDVEKIPNFKALYTVMCYDDGGVVDDLIVYKFSPEKYLLCLNAGNIEKDLEWLKQNVSGHANLKNISQETGLISLQGPKAESLLLSLRFENISGPLLSELKAFQFCEAKVEGIPCIVARTGYTGEDGFEFFHSAADSAKLWNSLMEKGSNFGIKAIGLGARDTLRLEAALPLYGHELNEERDPFQAGLSWVIKLNKFKFIGKVILLEKTKNKSQELVGIEVEGGIARESYPVLNESAKVIGMVTSGSPSPSTGKNIALAYRNCGEKIAAVEIRGKSRPAQEVSLPFVKKKPKK